MIVGLDKHPFGECFAELNCALEMMGRGDVVLNANAAPEQVPDGAVVWNFENLPWPDGQIPATTGPEHAEKWRVFSFDGHPLWDFSARNAEKWSTMRRRVTHVPVGHHPSMERFGRAEKLDIDVVFMGSVNERRLVVFQALSQRGLKVNLIGPGVYGAARDNILARAKLCVVPMFYEDGVFGSLRAAHLVANKVPCLFETAPEAWPFVSTCVYERLEQCAMDLLAHEETRAAIANVALERFKAMPLELPC